MKSMSSGIRGPVLRFWFYQCRFGVPYLPFKPQFSIWELGIIIDLLVGWLQGSNEIVHVNHSVGCLQHSKPSVNVTYSCIIGGSKLYPLLQSSS